MPALPPPTLRSMTAEELSWFVDDTVARALQGIKGVSRVERVGGVTREIRVALGRDRRVVHQLEIAAATLERAEP